MYTRQQHKLLLYETLSYQCIRPSATSVGGLKLLAYKTAAPVPSWPSLCTFVPSSLSLSVYFCVSSVLFGCVSPSFSLPLASPVCVCVCVYSIYIYVYR
jgi:hypothetical protein